MKRVTPLLSLLCLLCLASISAADSGAACLSASSNSAAAMAYKLN